DGREKCVSRDWGATRIADRTGQLLTGFVKKVYRPARQPVVIRVEAAMLRGEDPQWPADRQLFRAISVSSSAGTGPTTRPMATCSADSSSPRTNRPSRG